MLFPITKIAAVLVPLILGSESRTTALVNPGAIAILMSVRAFLILRLIFCVLTLSGNIKGLAPTLVIVRVAYSEFHDNTQQMTSIHFAGPPTQNGTRVTGAITNLDTRSRDTNEDLVAQADVYEFNGKFNGIRVV